MDAVIGHFQPYLQWDMKNVRRVNGRRDKTLFSSPIENLSQNSSHFWVHPRIHIFSQFFLFFIRKKIFTSILFFYHFDFSDSMGLISYDSLKTTLHTQAILVLFVTVGLAMNVFQAITFVLIRPWNRTLYRHIVQVTTFELFFELFGLLFLNFILNSFFGLS